MPGQDTRPKGACDTDSGVVEVLETLPLPAFLVEQLGSGRWRVLTVNAAHRESSGLGPCRGIALEELLPPETSQAVAANYERALRAGACIDYEEHLTLPQGPRWWRTWLTPCPAGPSGHPRLLGQSVDITEEVEARQHLAERQRKRKEQLAGARRELVQRVDQLSRANAELERFAAVASHDLQEPLRKIVSFGDRLEAVAGPALDARGQRYLATMQDSAIRLHQLIADLLRVSRAGGPPAELNPVDLERMVDDVVASLPPLPPEAQLTRGPLPVVLGHGPSLQRVMLNLLTNSLRHGLPPDGGSLHIELSARRLDPEHWELRLSDDGRGFDPDQAERIFEPFVRLDQGRPHRGAGIGLSICRRLVMAQGGQIRAEAGDRGGATLILVLQATESDASN